MSTRVIDLRIHGLVVTLEVDSDEVRSNIKSELHIVSSDTSWQSNIQCMLYNVGVDAIETMILNHAINGIDISSDEYKDAILCAVNELDEKYIKMTK